MNEAISCLSGTALAMILVLMIAGRRKEREK